MHCLSPAREREDTQEDVGSESRAHAGKFSGDDNVPRVFVIITLFHPLSSLARFDSLGVLLRGVLLSFSSLTSFSNVLRSSGLKSLIRLSLSLTSSSSAFLQYLTRSTTFIKRKKCFEFREWSIFEYLHVVVQHTMYNIHYTYLKTFGSERIDS